MTTKTRDTRQANESKHGADTKPSPDTLRDIVRLEAGGLPRAVPDTCPDCEKPSPYGVRCADCRKAFDLDCDALNSNLRDI